jgi:DNA-binding transcriptional LysR family regulator
MIFIRVMNLQSFDLNLLKVLDALLHEGSTVRAGQRIGLSQPAVSAALGRLRAALDDPLLVRDGQALRLTDFALTLVAPVRQLLEDTSRLLAHPAFDPATSTDTFRMAASDFFTEVLLPDLVARLEREAPHVVLRYTEAIGVGAMNDLREGRLDLALMPVQLLPPWIESEFLFHADFCIVARRDHPVLKRHGVARGAVIPMDIYCSLRHAVFRVVDEEPELEEQIVASLGYPIKVAVRAYGFSAVLQAVAASDLVGMIPTRLADRMAQTAGLDVYPTPCRQPKSARHGTGGIQARAD